MEERAAADGRRSPRAERSMNAVTDDPPNLEKERHGQLEACSGVEPRPVELGEASPVGWVLDDKSKRVTASNQLDETLIVSRPGFAGKASEAEVQQSFHAC